MHSFKLAPQENIFFERACGELSLAFENHDVKRFYQSGSAKAFIPKSYSQAIEVLLANTSGGLTDGDRMSYEIKADQNSYVTLTTQAAERVYRALGDSVAHAHIKLSATNESRLVWVPHETILYNQCQFMRHIDINLDASSTVVIGEMLVFGRKESGEVLTAGHVQDRWHIWQDDKLIHSEAFRITDPVREQLDHFARADTNVMATLIIVCPDDLSALVKDIQHMHKDEASWIEVSAWMNKLVVRIIAPDLYSIKPAIARILERMTASSLPRTWMI